MRASRNFRHHLIAFQRLSKSSNFCAKKMQSQPLNCLATKKQPKPHHTPHPYSNRPMAKYDMFLEIKRMKGFRNISSKSVYRRMDALAREGWIQQNGARAAKVPSESILFELALKGNAALRLDK
jgi:hypothetical protein